MSRRKENERQGMSRSSLILALVLAVAGLVLLIWPEAAMDVAVSVVGGALIVLGVGTGILYLLGRSGAPGRRDLIQAIASLVAGAAVLIFHGQVVKWLPVVIGAAIVVLGVVNLRMVLRMKRWGLKGWGWTLGAAIAGMLLGGLIIALPLAGQDLSAALLGAVLLFAGLVHLWISMRYARLEKIRRRAVEEAMDAQQAGAPVEDSQSSEF